MGTSLSERSLGHTGPARSDEGTGTRKGQRPLSPHNHPAAEQGWGAPPRSWSRVSPLPRGRGGRLCFLRPHLGLTLPPRPGEPVCVSHTTAPPHPCRAGVKGGEGPCRLEQPPSFHFTSALNRSSGSQLRHPGWLCLLGAGSISPHVHPEPRKGRSRSASAPVSHVRLQNLAQGRCSEQPR